MTNQTKRNNLNYLIDPIFTKVNRLLSYRLKKRTIEHLFQSITNVQIKDLNKRQ